MSLKLCVIITLGKILFLFYQENSNQDSSAVNLQEAYDQQLFISVGAALVPVVLAFSFIIFLFYRQRREAHFRQVELAYQLDKSDLEMKALRAQVNPHFIFNCLNSIQHFIHKNESELAENYLTKFSRLIRLVLENSTHTMVPIEDDIKALDLYIQMEQLRLNHSFDYTIDSENIDISDLYIPPLLIQPFVENSIWHGLTNMPENGNVTISLKLKQQVLKCTIEDNGVKVSSQKAIDSIKSKSLGLELIQQRLNLFKGKNDLDYYFTIKDRVGTDGDLIGKCVELILPFEYD